MSLRVYRYKNQSSFSARTLAIVLIIVGVSLGIGIPVGIYAFQSANGGKGVGIEKETVQMKDGIIFDIYSERDDILAKSPVVFTNTWDGFMTQSKFVAARTTQSIVGQVISTDSGSIACKFPVGGKIGDSVKIHGYFVNSEISKYVIQDDTLKVLVTVFVNEGLFYYYDMSTSGVIDSRPLIDGDYYSLRITFLNHTDYRVTLVTEGKSVTKTGAYYFGASMNDETDVKSIAFNSQTTGISFHLKSIMTSWESGLSSAAFTSMEIDVEEIIDEETGEETGEPAEVIEEQNSRVVEVDARYWSPWSTPTQNGVMYNFNDLSSILWIDASESGIEVNFEKVICDETKLKEILGVSSLYMSNGSPYIFKGLNAHNGYTNNIYDSIAAVTKGPNTVQPNGQKVNGLWYVRPFSVSMTGGNWPYLLSEMMKFDNVFVPPPPKQDTETDASAWWPDLWYSTTQAWNGMAVQINPSISVGTARVTISEASLEAKIGTPLYNSLGLPYIFKGVNCKFDAFTSGNGIGFLFKGSDGNWYLRPLSIGGTAAESAAAWPSCLAKLYTLVYNIPKA